MSEATYWNGLPTIATRGTAVVFDSRTFPEYWARPYVGQRVPVVRVNLDGVNAGGGVTYLYDGDGSGWRKVTVGHGSPRFGHRGIEVEDASFRPALLDDPAVGPALRTALDGQR